VTDLTSEPHDNGGHRAESPAYEDLFDIERRPGAGLALWTNAVELQLARVREVNYRHRLHSSPNKEEQRDDPDAEEQLHADVYFLALAVRRVLLFHDLLANRVADPRLAEARATFSKAAPNAKGLRDFYEHLDEYLLDDPKKHRKIPGRAAPILLLRWGSDDVVVAFGPLRMDVTLAAVAAIELGKASEAVWSDHLEQVKGQQPEATPPARDDGVPRMFEVSLGVSTIIGDEDEWGQVHTGVLLGTRVREATADEISEMQ
jgi:hypothetical protein